MTKPITREEAYAELLDVIHLTARIPLFGPFVFPYENGVSIVTNGPLGQPVTMDYFPAVRMSGVILKPARVDFTIRPEPRAPHCPRQIRLTYRQPMADSKNEENQP